jgi:hypothetical protein
MYLDAILGNRFTEHRHDAERHGGVISSPPADWECPELKCRPILTEVFVILESPSRQVPGLCLKLGHILYNSYRQTLYCLSCTECRARVV